VNYRRFSGIAVFGLTLIAVAITANAATKKGGALANNYASQIQILNDSTMVVTTRKLVTGDVREINIPGSKVFNAFEQVKAAALLRTAVEAKSLGFKFFSVSGYSDLTLVREKRSASKSIGGAPPENTFVFAYGHFTNDVEVALELTIQLSNVAPRAESAEYVDVEQILAANGI
jgi:hypothetical protein